MKIKFYFLFYIFFIFTGNLIAKIDTLINKTPLMFEVSYLGSAVSNLSGGIKKGTCYLGMANLRISYNTEKAKLWKGGQFFINGANTHGGAPSADLTGDFQGISNIEADDLTYFHELWYKQIIGNLSITTGIQDLNTEFISSENAGLYFNSTFGTHSTIADNVPASIFPLTAFGLQFQYNISENISGKIIVFDGFPDISEDNPYNLRLRFNDGLLTVSELAFSKTFKNNLKGKFKIGGYTHNHFTASNSDTGSPKPTNNYGFYLVADQMVFQNLKGQQFSVFTQASISPYQKNVNWYYLGFGFNFHGLFPKRINDVVGFAVANAGFRKNNNSNETILELTYKALINENIYIQPDFQFILNPSGTNEKLNNAFVANLRFGLNF